METLICKDCVKKPTYAIPNISKLYYLWAGGTKRINDAFSGCKYPLVCLKEGSLFRENGLSGF